MKTPRELLEQPGMMAIFLKYKYEEASLAETCDKLIAAIAARDAELIEAFDSARFGCNDEDCRGGCCVKAIHALLNPRSKPQD